MKLVREQGFTLIELLTVIAIIAILAGLTAVTLPRVLEKAKLADADTDMKAIATSLSQYYTDHGTYPAAYGYRMEPLLNGNFTYNQIPYTFDIGIEEATKLMDRFANDYDTDRNDILTRLEFLPVQMLDTAIPDPYLAAAPDFVPYPSLGAQNVTSNAKRAGSPRPYTYIPFNKKDIARMNRIIKAEANQTVREGMQMGDWDPGYIPNASEGILMPPPQYDGFVLMSVGPLISTRGLLTPPADEDTWLANTGEDQENWYYVLGMRAAYLAMRDLNGNGQLDFDYRARTQQGEGKLFPQMPDGKIEGYASPLIFVSQ